MEDRKEEGHEQINFLSIPPYKIDDDDGKHANVYWEFSMYQVLFKGL